MNASRIISKISYDIHDRTWAQGVMTVHTKTNLIIWDVQ